MVKKGEEEEEIDSDIIEYISSTKMYNKIHNNNI